MHKIHQKLHILFCDTTCTSTCPPTCPLHAPPLILLQEFIIPLQTPSTLPITLPDLATPIIPSLQIWNQIKLTLPNAILAHRFISKKVRFCIIRTYHTYLCKWTFQDNICYKKWQNQFILLHPKQQSSHKYHINNLITYYTNQQNNHYYKFIGKHFNPSQIKDTRHISPILHLPLITISIHECNLDKDIITTTNTIHVHDQ